MEVYLRRDTVETLRAIEDGLSSFLGVSIGHAGKAFLVQCALAHAAGFVNFFLFSYIADVSCAVLLCRIHEQQSSWSWRKNSGTCKISISAGMSGLVSATRHTTRQSERDCIHEAVRSLQEHLLTVTSAVSAVNLPSGKCFI